jgi:hypothetical protein
MPVLSSVYLPSALGRVRVLKNLSFGLAKDSIDFVFTQWQGAPRWSFLGSTTPTHPLYYVCIFGDDVHYFVAGISTQVQAQGIWDGYLREGPAPYGRDDNAWYAYAAQEIADNVRLRQPNASGRIYFHGHSAGGAICFYLRKIVRASINFDTPTIVTFGAPKATRQRAPGVLGDQTETRFFNSDDPVPLIPPDVRRSAWWVGVPTARGLARASDFVIRQSGLELGIASTVRAWDEPSIAALTPVASVSAWLTSVQQDQLSPHSLDVYEGRLLGAIARQPVIPPATIRGLPVPRPDPVPIAEAVRIVRSATAGVIAIAERQSQIQVNIPPDRLFRAVRENGIWVCKFGDVIIASGPQKKRARAFAFSGNEFLRRLQRQGIVNTPDLANQFMLYLASASDPTSGFTPQLQTMP